MATWGDQTCQRFEATAVGFETGFSRLRVRPSNRYAIAPHKFSILATIFRKNINVLLSLWDYITFHYRYKPSLSVSLSLPWPVICKELHEPTIVKVSYIYLKENR